MLVAQDYKCRVSLGYGLIDNSGKISVYCSLMFGGVLNSRYPRLKIAFLIGLETPPVLNQ